MSHYSTSKENEWTPHSWNIIYLVSMSFCHLAVIAPVSSYRSLASVRFDTVGAGRNFYNNIGWFSSGGARDPARAPGRDCIKCQSVSYTAAGLSDIQHSWNKLIGTFLSHLHTRWQSILTSYRNPLIELRIISLAGLTSRFWWWSSPFPAHWTSATNPHFPTWLKYFYFRRLRQS